MSAPNVSVFMLERLHEWGVRRIYGYPGDGINGLLGAFHEVGEEIEFVQPRHEELAAFAACAHAKFTGEVGRLHGDLRPGRHPPAQRPLRRQARPPAGGRASSASRSACRWAATSSRRSTCTRSSRTSPASTCRGHRSRPGRARRRPRRAHRRSRRTVTAIIVPADVQELAYDEPPARPRARSTPAVGYRARVIGPRDEDLRRAADVLNAGERVAMLIGQGAKHAADEVIEVAELLGAGVAKALNGRAVLPDDLPFVTGSIGLLGTKPSYDMMEGCDTLLMVGTRFPYSEWLPEPGPGARRADRHRRRPARHPLPDRGPTSAATPATTLRALVPLLERKQDRAWRQEIEEGVERWWRLLGERAHVEAEPINPQLVFHELSARLPDDASSPPTRARRPTGGPATCACARGWTPPCRDAGHDVPGRALRAGGQVRLPRPAGHRLPRRRRDADARHQRADRPRPLPRALGRPLHRRRAPQRRPQPGHLGAARHRRRPQARGLPGAAATSPSPPTPACSAWRASA